MNDTLALRLCAAVEQLALELAEVNGRASSVAPISDNVRLHQAVATGPLTATPQRFLPIGGGLPPADWVCPIHGTSKHVPAGISTKSGQPKPYEGFTCCPEQGCKERPPKWAQPAPSRAIPPSQGVQQLP